MSWRPKAYEEIIHYTQHQKYTIHVNLNKETEILTINVTDIYENEWQQQFKPIHFRNNVIYDLIKITKILIDAIKPLNIHKRCKIIIHSNWCYLTIDNGAILPSFALLKTQTYSLQYSSFNKLTNNTPIRTYTQKSNEPRSILKNYNNYRSDIQLLPKTQKVRHNRAMTAIKYDANHQKGPPPVTLDMLVNYGVYNKSNNNNNDNKKPIKTANTPRKKAKPPPKPTRPSSKTVCAPPPPRPKRIDAPPPPKRANTAKAAKIAKRTRQKPLVPCTKGRPHDDNKNNNNNNNNNNGKSKGEYGKLIKIYNDYIRERGEKPSNTFDLINYIQFNGINGINFKDVGKFLMNYNPK